MNDPLPSQLSDTAPAQVKVGISEPLVFDFIPRLRHLLPRFRGLPGYEYAQIAVQNMRRAQAERWTEVDNTYVYTIKGPEGQIDMKLFVRGKRILGQGHDSGRRVLKCDTLVEEVTGLKIQEGSPDGEVKITQTASEPVEAKPEGGQSPKGRPESDQPSGSGKGSGDTPKPKG